MKDSITWVGMDVHKENILAVALAHDSQKVLARFETPNTPKGLERLAKRISEFGSVRAAYEAGPCGYAVRRFLTERGIRCDGPHSPPFCARIGNCDKLKFLR